MELASSAKGPCVQIAQETPWLDMAETSCVNDAGKVRREPSGDYPEEHVGGPHHREEESAEEAGEA